MPTITTPKLPDIIVDCIIDEIVSFPDGDENYDILGEWENLSCC